ncbi:MAG: hypothetical protein ABIR78_01820 [Ferruginibacter sp.]
MRTVYFILISGIIFSSGNLFAQDTLPAFTVKNSKGKISVSWQNNYSKEVKGITIQSSFDSLKKYSSLKTVPNPADAVNGFFDTDVPYEKMFYRLFIVFDSGVYFFTPSKRPEIDPKFDLQKSLTKIREANKAIATASNKTDKIVIPVPRKEETANSKSPKPAKPEGQPISQTEEVKPEIIIKKEPVSTVSRYIYTAKDNNIVINLPDFSTNKYLVKFYDEENRSLFELNKITEGFLIIEKVNFLHAGWFFFEIYKNEALLEKNKFYIPKD